jgi:hypothetical protein
MLCCIRQGDPTLPDQRVDDRLEEEDEQDDLDGRKFVN